MMTAVNTEFTVPCAKDQAVLAVQDVLDKLEWGVINLSSTEIITKSPQIDFFKKSSAPKVTINFRAVGEHTRIAVTVSLPGPVMPSFKKNMIGVMGQLVNSTSLRVQTQSIAINPSVQIGDGQTTSPDDRFDLLRKAKSLLDSGALTAEEFEAEKRKILGT